MREKERIERILQLVRKCWHICPDLRLFQLLCMVTFLDHGEDIFYYEDDKLERALKEWLEANEEK